MDKDDLYKNLVTLLNTFKNRPYHLSKYLLENMAFTEDFMEKISRSKKLSEIKTEDNIPNTIYFADISKMHDYYTSLVEETKGKTVEQITEELNEKLRNLIYDEKYEEAARLRDYMSRNKIKRDNNKPRSN